jgi:hypothetical protein
MRESGEALVNELAITDGLDVLDLGWGDGTTALPAARLDANVLGVDIASNLVDAGNARARSLGVTNCSFQDFNDQNPGGSDPHRDSAVVPESHGFGLTGLFARRVTEPVPITSTRVNIFFTLVRNFSRCGRV